MKIVFILFLLLLTGCSTKKAPNTWEHNSATNAQAYVKYFLEDKEILAKAAYRRTRDNAKQSASLDTLAKVYLLKCSLNQASGISDSCTQYLKIEHLVDDNKIKSYYAFLKGETFDVQMLPVQYKDFASSQTMKQKRVELFKIEPLVSKLIAASTIKDDLSEKDLQQLLKESSYYGYKRTNLMFLKLLAQRAKDKETKAKYLEKIEVLN